MLGCKYGQPHKCTIYPKGVREDRYIYIFDFYKVDVREGHAIQQSAQDPATSYGQIDILINTAGIADPNIKAETYDVDSWVVCCISTSTSKRLPCVIYVECYSLGNRSRDWKQTPNPEDLCAIGCCLVGAMKEADIYPVLWWYSQAFTRGPLDNVRWI